MNQQTPTTEFDTFDEQNFANKSKQNKWDKILNILLVAVLIVLVTTVVVSASDVPALTVALSGVTVTLVTAGVAGT